MDPGNEDEAAAAVADGQSNPSLSNPHAFHRNLPKHYLSSFSSDTDTADETQGGGGQEGIPYVTEYADRKARAVVDLVKSIQLTEASFTEDDNTQHDENDEEQAQAVDDDEEEEEDQEMKDIRSLQKKNSIAAITKKCTRINSILSSLHILKYGGITQEELCWMILHVLKLVCATVTFEDDSNDENGDADEKTLKQLKVKTLKFDNIGYLHRFSTMNQTEPDNIGNNETMTMDFDTASSNLEKDLTDSFALPTPARESLLTVALNLLAKESLLRSISNTSITVSSSSDDDNTKSDDETASNDLLLIIHWKAFLRMLLRTSPYLDEFKTGLAPLDSASRQSTILKRTVSLIRELRRFYHQGLQVKQNIIDDTTAVEVWNMVKDDLLHQSHSNSCFRAAIILYLFQPSRCSSTFYLNVLPQWMEGWTNVDRCADYDFIFCTLFCRARKYTEPGSYDWGPLRRRLLTLCGYWLQIPVGGSSVDKSFPRAGDPKARSFLARLKAFMGARSSYSEGISFVGKMSKLLVFCLGKNMEETGTGTVAENGEQNDVVMMDIESDVNTELGSTITNMGFSKAPTAATASKAKTDSHQVSDGTEDMLRFLAFVAPYFNPSNTGSWTLPLGILLHYISYEFCHRLGITASQITLSRTHPHLAQEICKVEPYKKAIHMEGNEIATLLDSLLPLCQQALYSKNQHVCSAGESALFYLAQIDPIRVCPPFLDSAIRALDICSVTLSHQAPAALSAVNRLALLVLRRKPALLLERLPAILGLSLAGIDSNDQNKTLKTLSLYRNLTQWIAVGNVSLNQQTAETSSSDENNGIWTFGKSKDAEEMMKTLLSFCQSDKYVSTVAQLPESSLLHTPSPTKESNAEEEEARLQNLIEEAELCMSDWSLAFLERIYGIFRSAGEREKVGKSHGLATRHSSADVSRRRNFSRVLKETLMQLFAAMDENCFDSAMRSIADFLSGETLHMASKDASSLCDALAYVRTYKENVQCSPGLDIIVPILTNDLAHQSKNAILYRLRCLSGAVRHSGKSLLKHREAINLALQTSLSEKDDKRVFKAGCKLLRHALASQCESYPIATAYCPRVQHIGRSAQLRQDGVEWHIPSGEQIDFVVDIFCTHAFKQIQNVYTIPLQNSSEKADETSMKSSDVVEWRRCLRVVRYALRGCSCVLLHIDKSDKQKDSSFQLAPQELATMSLLSKATPSSKGILTSSRGKLTQFVASLLSVIANGSASVESISAGDNQVMASTLLAADTKICKETIEISLILLTKRGSSSRMRSDVWRMQKTSLKDYSLSVQRNEIIAVYRKTGKFAPSDVLYKDGEEGGKSISRRLLVERLNMFLSSVERQSSFEIPRRLRRLQKAGATVEGKKLMSMGTKIDTVYELIGAYFHEDSIKNQSNDLINPLHDFEQVFDGLLALSCHPNGSVRASGIGAVEYALTRFGWFVEGRVPRLLDAISLNDSEQNGLYGVPSCAELTSQFDSKGKRKRLSEVMKGVCSIVAIPRTMRTILLTEKSRFTLVKTLCGTQHLISLLPTEEMQKMLHYFHSIFSQFRSRYFYLPRLTKQSCDVHEACLSFLIQSISPTVPLVEAAETKESSPSEKKENGSDKLADAKSMHWRNRLIICWFILTFTNKEDLIFGKKNPCEIWEICFDLIRTEVGQPLQRVSLALLGRLVTLTIGDTNLVRLSRSNFTSSSNSHIESLQENLREQSFCQDFGKALVYDHREDSSVGGGHHAQWSLGVQDVLKDSTSNLAPRILFPFQRVGRWSNIFKLQHAQLLHAMLFLAGRDDAIIGATHLLSFAKDLAASPPSEDQRNQLCTAAEIFSGVSRALIHLASDKDDLESIWTNTLLPFLDDVIHRIPVSTLGTYFDALRFAIHQCPPGDFYALTTWAIKKIEDTLWKQQEADNSKDSEVSDASGTTSGDGFATQSKWLALVEAVLVHLDMETKTSNGRGPWYSNVLVGKASVENDDFLDENILASWKLVVTRLLPCLLNALGHPYQSCRAHIAECVYRICYCFGKLVNGMKTDTSSLLEDPRKIIIEKLSQVAKSSEYSFKSQQHALITVRKFISCCIHWGDNKAQFSSSIIPLMPLAFEAVKSSNDEDVEMSSANRMIQAEVVKSYRYCIAEMGVSCMIANETADDIARVLSILDTVSKHEFWQVRQATAHFLRCFQGSHKYLFTVPQTKKATRIVALLLCDERREVSSAAMSALTGILAATALPIVNRLVEKYRIKANNSVIKTKKKQAKQNENLTQEEIELKEKERANKQQMSVFFLCAAVLARPYDTPPYVPRALAALSRHSYERSAPFHIREAVKMCCGEFKRTHMSDNWELHRQQFTTEELEALEDVVSTPHYYA